MSFLIGSLAALFVGPLSYGFVRHATRTLRALDIVIVVLVGALLLLDIIPETVKRGGWVALAPLGIGLLGPIFLERTLARIERQAHFALIGLIAVGLGIHAVMDGVALVL
jgi:hypothetical protein